MECVPKTMMIGDLIPSDRQVFILRNKKDNRIALWSIGEAGLGPLVYPSFKIAKEHLEGLKISGWTIFQTDIFDLLDEANGKPWVNLWFPSGLKFISASIAEFQEAVLRVAVDLDIEEGQVAS